MNANRFLLLLVLLLSCGSAWGAKISFYGTLTTLTDCDPRDFSQCKENQDSINQTEIELPGDFEVWRHSVNRDGIDFGVEIEVRKISDGLYEVNAIATATESANHVNFHWANFQVELSSGETIRALSTRSRPFDVGNRANLMGLRLMQLTAIP